MPSALLVRGTSHPWMPLNGEADCDDHEESGRRLYPSTVTLTDCRVSTLLPAPPPQLTGAALTTVLRANRDAISNGDEREAHIDIVLSHLSAASSSPGADADGCDDAMRDAVVTLYDVWRHVNGRISLTPSPSVCLPDGHIRELLHMYAEASVELASNSLLRTLTTATEFTVVAEAEMAVAVASLSAVHEILGAQQVARIAASHTAAAPADKHILDRIRTLLLALLGASSSFSGCAQFFLHSNVELSIDPTRSVAGCGLVAIGAVGEGELLAREAALATVADAEVRVYCQGGTEAMSDVATATEHMKRRLRIWKESARRCQEDTTTAPVSKKVAAVPSSGARQRKDSVPLIIENVECSATAQLLGLLARFPDLLCGGWRQWAALVMRDASVLQPSPCVSRVAVDWAGKPQTEAGPKNTSCNSHFTADASQLRVLNWRGGEAHASLPSAPQLLLDVRGIDEFRIDPPPRSYCHKERDEHHRCVKAGLKRAAGECDVAAYTSLCASDVSAKALFLFLRHLNHACIPNALLVLDRTPGCLHDGDNDGVVVSLVALRGIESGEEITVSYVPATTALTVSQTELAEMLGFRCRCHLCERKAALLHGHLCGECGQLIYEPDIRGESEPPISILGATCASEWATVFRHGEHCPHRRRTCEADSATEERSSVAAQLQLQLDDIPVQLAKGEDEAETSGKARDSMVAAMRRLVDLDACVARTLLPTHFLRLRLRLEAFAYSTVARGLGSTLSAELIHLCANTLEELEMLMPANHPLLTGLRMYLVFSRGRHLRAVNAAEDVAHGTRHAECCGAVREQAALMQLPFVVDPLVRRCVARCFQEHYVQLLAWRAEWLSHVGEAGALGSFLARYSVELEACGVTTVEHIELLSCMEDGAQCV
ncbi:hypothetical protein LPMP_330520 [Leishmania panamensis]|uniref:SET domain-containing protein n=1 Tax=Leishmania panamensis TaxID=5679 RepID=A0A088S1B1_LEIPA|nr:hypothetical protein LPMP_330520 [Leishmania panamensis]AIO01345.1 hypothetical protein LPMP_330520 [Leishmania panamensis]